MGWGWGGVRWGYFRSIDFSFGWRGVVGVLEFFSFVNDVFIVLF